MEAVATASRKAADTWSNDFVMQHFQQALPPGLDWEGFVSQPNIQARWRALIDTPAETTLAPNMGFPAFRQAVYDPRVDRLVQPRLADLLGSPDDFAPDGSRGQAGRAAAYWVTVPALLLAVTVLGILWHAGRLLDLGCSMLLPRIVAEALGRGGMHRHRHHDPVLGVAATARWRSLATRQRHQRVGADRLSATERRAFRGFDFGYDPALRVI